MARETVAAVVRAVVCALLGIALVGYLHHPTLSPLWQVCAACAALTVLDAVRRARWRRPSRRTPTEDR